jgi:hypothetical protein
MNYLLEILNNIIKNSIDNLNKNINHDEIIENIFEFAKDKLLTYKFKNSQEKEKKLYSFLKDLKFIKIHRNKSSNNLFYSNIKVENKPIKTKTPIKPKYDINQKKFNRTKLIKKNENLFIQNEKEEEKKKEKEKQHYIEIIKEKDYEITKLKNELEHLKKIAAKKNNIKNITMISMRPNSFRQEDKKNSFEINKSATIDKLSRITNKSPNQNSFLKGNSTLSSSCYSHRIAYFSPKGKINYPYNNRNIDTSIGNKNSIEADISNYKCEVKEILDKIIEKTKKVFGKISKVNKL